jgi:hypothetical protein
MSVFTPHTSGYFKVYISDLHGPLLGSPYNILVYPRETNETEPPIVESSGIRDSICNEETRFLVRCKDSDIEVQIRGTFYQDFSF